MKVVRITVGMAAEHKRVAMRERGWSAPAGSINRLYKKMGPQIYHGGEDPLSIRNGPADVALSASSIRNPRLVGLIYPLTSLFPCAVSTEPQWPATAPQQGDCSEPVEKHRGSSLPQPDAEASGESYDICCSCSHHQEVLERCNVLEKMVAQLQEELSASRSQNKLLIDANKNVMDRYTEATREKEFLVRELAEKKNENEQLQEKVNSLREECYDLYEMSNQVCNLVQLGEGQSGSK